MTIITDLNVPKSCYDCNMKNILCHCPIQDGETVYYRSTRHTECPIKPLERLIEKLNELKLSEPVSDCDSCFNNGLKVAISLIKEYYG